MDQKQLQASLEELRAEIHELKSDDQVAKAKLDGLIEDIEKHIANSGDSGDHESLVENLNSAVSEFEVSHPRATGILNHILMTLSNMGI